MKKMDKKRVALRLKTIGKKAFLSLCLTISGISLYGQTPATLPYTDDFTSTISDWTILNGTETNQWYIGSATGNTGNSLYVSNDAGTSNAYTVSPSSASSVVQAYRDIVLTAGSNPFHFQFDWKCKGEGFTTTNYDYFRVWIVPNTFVPTPGTQITATSSGGIQLGGNINDETSWITENFVIPDSLAGDTVRLVFEWRNDASSGTQPPAAIDNINISQITCVTPSGLNTNNLTSASADINWIAPASAPANGYEYYYNTNNVAPDNTTTPSGSVGAGVITASLSSLSSNTQYYFWVRSVCSGTDTSDWSNFGSFTTPCSMFMAPWVYDVEAAATTTSATIEDCWSADPSGTSSPYRWNVDGGGSTPSTNTGPSGPHSGTNYFYTEASSGSNGDSAALTSPLVDVSGLTTPALEFYYHLYGSDIGSLYIGVSDGASWSLVDSIIGEQQTDDTDPWIKKTIILTGYTDTVQVRFISVRIGSGGSDYEGDMALDDISVIEAPTCFEPTSIVVSNITDATADIAWVAPTPVSGNGYEYYYDTSNTPPDNTTLASGSVGAGVLTAGLSGLAGNTTYYVWLRSLCSATDTSVWSSSASFTTLCGTYMAPWSYDVETAATTTSAIIEECWSADPNNTSSEYRWNVDGSGSTPSSNTGPSGAYSGTNYFYTEASNGSNDDTASLTSPVIDVSGLTTPAVEFYYHMYGADIGRLYIEISDGITWTTIDSLIGEQQTDDIDPWIKKTIILTAYAGTTLQIRFTAMKTGSSSDLEGDMALDDISVIEAPTCFEPTNIVVSNVTDATADISWTAPTPAPANGYEYYYSTSNTAPDNTTTPSGSVGAGILTASLSGLAGNTEYYVWARSLCNATDTSVWSSSASFTTLCSPIATLPWTEDFESLTTTGSSIFPECWLKENGDWASSASTTYNSAHSGTKYIRDSYSATDEYMWTPPFQLTAGTSYEFSFFVQGDGFTDWNVDIFQNTTQSSAGASQIGNTYSPSGPGSVAAQPYVKQIYNFVPTTSGVYHFAVRINVNGSPWYLAFDDFRVRLTPSCYEPFGTNITNIAATAATVNWAASLTPPSNGYQYYYSTSNTAPTSSTTASGAVGAGTTTVDLTTLTPNTQYYVWVRSICSATDTSEWSASAEFKTPCLEIAPWTYDVESASTTTSANISDCWSTTPTGSSEYAWNVDGSGSTPSSSTGPSGAFSGSKYFYVEASNGSGDEALLSSPMVDISGLTDPALSFYYHMYGTVIGNLYVQIYDGSAWNTVDSIMGEQQTATTDPWLQRYVGLGSYTGVIQVRFKAVSVGTFAGDISLDDIRIDNLPPCPAPDTLSANNIDVHSATVNWNDNGSGIYTVEFGNSGFAVGTGISDTITDITYDISGLDPNTSYDFYIRSICIPGVDTSNYSIAGSFTTLCDTPLVTINNDTAICEGLSIILDAGNPGSIYLWNNATTNQTLSIDNAGTYSVEVMNIYGCVASDTMALSINPNPIVDLGPDQPLCDGASLVLDAGGVNVTYLWNTTATTQALTVDQAGIYSVTITDMNYCQGSDTVEIIGHSAPLVNGISAVQNANGSYDFTATGAAHIDTYLWDFGDQTGTSSEEHPNHSYFADGNYTVTLVVSNDCGTDTITALLHYYGTGVAILNVSKDLLTLYPNPAKDQVTLKNASNFKMEYLTVYNILGQVVFKCSPEDAYQYTLDVSDYAPGIYNIQLKMNEGLVFRKFEVLK